MCIIVYKPKGAPLPSQNLLSDCFHHNPDGAGIMFHDPRRGLIIRKGMMNSDEFLRVCDRLRPCCDDIPVVIHCRWATHGGVQPGLCHPFPIDNRRNILTALVPRNVKMAVVHNGVIPQWSGKDQDVSDTLLYVQNELYPALRDDPDYLSDPRHRRHLADTSMSRLTFMDSGGNVTLVGQFFAYGGVYYSKQLVPRRTQFKKFSKF